MTQKIPSMLLNRLGSSQKKLKFTFMAIGWLIAGLSIIFNATFLARAQASNENSNRRIEQHNNHEVAAAQVLVKFSSTATPQKVAQAKQAADIDYDEPVGDGGLRLIHSHSKSVAALIEALSNRSDVTFVEPNYVIHVEATPNDPQFAQLYALQISGATGSIGAASAWDISTGSRRNVAAVTDTGIDYNHPDLAANVWSAPSPFTVNIGGETIHCAAGSHGYNTITKTCDPMDDHGHGTHVSGTIGAVGNNGVGVAGVNWSASIMGVKFLDASGSGTVADAINAIEFTIQAKAAFASSGGANVRVLNNSWGSSGEFSQALLDEINKTNDSDMLFVAAAGNSANNNDDVASAFYPAGYNAPNIIAVAATNSSDNLASFSNYGANTVHLAAPGVSILSTTPGNGYAYLSGTSMATPHVVGAAALLLSSCSFNTAGLKTTLLSNIDSIPALSGNTITGGRLNVNKALRASCATPAPTPTPSLTPTPSPTPAAPTEGLQYYALPSPVRLLDTRSGESACDTPATALAANATRTEAATTPCSGIPSVAKAVVGNATVVSLAAGGYITLYPSGANRPTASNLNYTAGQTVPNSFTVGLGADGAFNIYASSSTHFVVDVTGYYAPPGQGGLYYHPLPRPVRLLDTRNGESACDTPNAPLAGGSTRTEAARTTCSGATIPATARAIVGNATVVAPEGSGSGISFITLYPSGGNRPTVSNLNYTAGQTVPNSFTVGLGADGAFNIYAKTTTDFVVDIAGYYSADPSPDVNAMAGLLYFPLSAPVRLLDTRSGEPACDTPNAPLAGGGTRTELARGTCSGQTIPATAQAIVGNATVVNNTANGGFITLFPSGGARPNASNLNFVSGQVVPNSFTVGLGGDGAFNIYVSSTTDFIVDLAGYFAP